MDSTLAPYPPPNAEKISFDEKLVLDILKIRKCNP
jgi:hypothetical protein